MSPPAWRRASLKGLEVDEAALTGESLPVGKAPEGGTAASRIVLAGSDVTVGTGLAVVVAVGRQTRMGATAAALAVDETRASPLGVRLHRMLRQVLPMAGAGGLVVLLSGLIRGRQLVSQFAIGASIAIAAVPEGLPLLAGVGEAAVARRLAGRGALVAPSPGGWLLIGVAALAAVLLGRSLSLTALPLPRQRSLAVPVAGTISFRSAGGAIRDVAACQALGIGPDAPRLASDAPKHPGRAGPHDAHCGSTFASHGLGGPIQHFGDDAYRQRQKPRTTLPDAGCYYQLRLVSVGGNVWDRASNAGI